MNKEFLPYLLIIAHFSKKVNSSYVFCPFFSGNRVFQKKIKLVFSGWTPFFQKGVQ